MHAESAFAKVNLCLFLGPRRPDGRHELVTLFESVDLADRLLVSPAAGRADEVICPGVKGPNLVAGALAQLRAAGWNAPAVRVEIEKRIAVAAGMGGGSADAAAMLRHAARLAPVAPAILAAIAAGLGADVPSQLDPGPSLGTGAGDVVTPVAPLPSHSLLILPQPFELSTAAVYREADRLGLARGAGGLARLRAQLETALELAAHTPRGGPTLDGEPAPPGEATTLQGEPTPPPRLPGLIANDLQPAALSLRPELGPVLTLARVAGADEALVCGSGPTVMGIFWGPAGRHRARRAAAELRGRFPGAAAVGVVDRGVIGSTPNE